MSFCFILKISMSFFLSLQTLFSWILFCFIFVFWLYRRTFVSKIFLYVALFVLLVFFYLTYPSVYLLYLFAISHSEYWFLSKQSFSFSVCLSSLNVFLLRPCFPPVFSFTKDLELAGSVPRFSQEMCPFASLQVKTKSKSNQNRKVT